ncbi:MAG: PP2C family protein-serine/threonine phosphatase [Chloroflexales bacterium]|nr:PP2C family protein-serine/threonine phosphatase [Chloroflexales bacterium]
MQHRLNGHSLSKVRQPHRLSSTLLGHSAKRRYRRRHGHEQIVSGNQSLNTDGPIMEASNRSPQELQRQVELEQDLQLARDIQQGLLLAAAPHIPGWELSAVSLPARDLGGDLYDFLELSDGFQGIMIGDVAGKGLPAALQMAVTRTVFRHEARQGTSPKATLAAVNRGVLNEIPLGMVTMLYALLDPQRGLLRLSNAGHTFPLLVNGNAHELEVSGLPLGVVSDADYDEKTVVLKPGDCIVLYSDGVTEAFNVAESMFGVDRLQVLLAANSHLKPRAIVSLLLHELRAWGTNCGQSDDITIVVLRRRLDCVSDELCSIMNDVLGIERAVSFWEEIMALQSIPLEKLTPDEWLVFLPSLAKLGQSYFGRGLRRELSQQLRLAIEDYRVQRQ